MSSTFFGFKKIDEDLFKQLVFVENNIRLHPEEAMMSLRRWAELMTRRYEASFRFDIPEFETKQFAEKLKLLKKQSRIKKNLIDRFYSIKDVGNIATHNENSISVADAIRCLNDARIIACDYFF